jgi:hypothetical protein
MCGMARPISLSRPGDIIEWATANDEDIRRELVEHCPADVFTGGSGDTGSRVVGLIREVDRLRAEPAAERGRRAQ